MVATPTLATATDPVTHTKRQAQLPEVRQSFSSIRHNASSMAGMLDMAAQAYTERFQPRTLEQYHAAVATVWNLLDRNIEKAARNCRSHQHCPGTPFGYIRPAQLEHYSSFVWRKGPMRYCEIGFNGGHGTVAMLLANPKLQAHSFELGGYAYTAAAAELVQLYFGERFQYHLGNSQKLVPAFAEQKHHNRRANFHPAVPSPPRPPRLTRRLLPAASAAPLTPHLLLLPLTSPAPLTLPATVTAPPSLPPPTPPRMYHCRRRLRPRPPQRSSCDVLLVDGDHGHRGALQDIRNMRALAKPGAVLLVDDLDEGPGPALRQAQAEGLVEMLEMRMFNASTVADELNPCIRRVRAPMWNCKKAWGWAVARYL